MTSGGHPRRHLAQTCSQPPGQYPIAHQLWAPAAQGQSQTRQAAVYTLNRTPSGVAESSCQHCSSLPILGKTHIIGQHTAPVCSPLLERTTTTNQGSTPAMRMEAACKGRSCQSSVEGCTTHTCNIKAHCSSWLLTYYRARGLQDTAQALCHQARAHIPSVYTPVGMYV